MRYARPKSGSLTARVWDIADELALRSGQMPTVAQVAHIYLAEGGQIATCQTQFSRWKKTQVAYPATLTGGGGSLSVPLPEAEAMAGPDKVVVRPRWDHLLKNGFTYVADWIVTKDGQLIADRPVPSGPGVYVFVIQDEVVYIGVTTSISRRMGNYRGGNRSQSTSFRINGELRKAIDAGLVVRTLFAQPGKSHWNNLPVDLEHGLEHGLIDMFRPPWNIRGGLAQN